MSESVERVGACVQAAMAGDDAEERAKYDLKMHYTRETLKRPVRASYPPRFAPATHPSLLCTHRARTLQPPLPARCGQRLLPCAAQP